jgi:hypothetical protein
MPDKLVSPNDCVDFRLIARADAMSWAAAFNREHAESIWKAIVRKLAKADPW